MSILSDRRSRFLVAAPSRALRFLPATAFALDSASTVGAVFLAIVGREQLTVFDTQADVSGSLMVVGPLMVAAWLAIIAFSGGYSRSIFDAGTDEYKRVFNATLLTAGLVGVGCFLAKFSLSRGFFLLAFALGLPALVLGRVLFRRAIHAARKRGTLLHTVLIAGSSAHVDEIASVLRRERWLGYQVVGALTPMHDDREETAGGVPVLGNCDDVTSIALECRADIVFFASGALKSANQMRHVAWDLEQEDVQVVVAPSVTDVSGERVRVRPVGGLPLIHIDPPRSLDASRWAKRLFDLVVGLALVIAFIPAFVIAAVRIKAHDRGPILFRQTRTGRNGEEFQCLKLRTMVTDAEERLAELYAEAGHDEGLFKLKDDPRITKPGKWLRRLSLDEIPQLVNVLRGEMSLVGPRPPLPLEVDRYESDTHRRLHVRPGMTGLWQVSGRSDLSWTEAVRLDLYYVDNWSMLQDISILMKTVGAVVRSHGAY